MNKGRTWLPSPAEAEQAVRSFFRVVVDEFEVVRTRVVGEAVARHMGIKWSPRLAGILRPVLQRMGAVEANLYNVMVWKGLRPRHFDRKDALALSNTLRKRKRPVEAPQEEAA